MLEALKTTLAAFHAAKPADTPETDVLAHQRLARNLASQTEPAFHVRELGSVDAIGRVVQRTDAPIPRFHHDDGSINAKHNANLGAVPDGYRRQVDLGTREVVTHVR